MVNTDDRPARNDQVRTLAPAISFFPWLWARLNAAADAVVADLAVVWLHLTAAGVGGVARHAALTGVGVIIILMTVTLLARDDGISFLLVKSDET